jgi:hypothetical protein
MMLIRALPLKRWVRRDIRTGRRRLALVGLGAFAVLGISAVGWAFWTGTSVPGGNGAAAAATVNQGTVPNASPGPAQSVPVSWTATTLTNGQPVAGYLVKRYDASTSVLQTTLAGCAGTITATSCTETSVPIGQWKYAVVPVIGTNWQGTESTKSGTVTVAASVLTLTKTIFGAPLPNATTGSLSGFGANEAITYRLDAATVLAGSPSTADSSGAASVSGLTIPAGTSNGSHTVYALGGSSSTASLSIIVDTTAPTASALLSPTANGAGWNNSTPVSVTLTGSDPGGSGVSQIKYTTDNSNPTSSGTAQVYSSPISIATTMPVKFFATDAAGNASGVYTQQVNIDTAAPTNSLTLTNTTGSSYKSGNTVYYNGASSGSFKVSNALTDSGTSGAASSGTSSLGGTTTGWTHTSSLVTGSSPYLSNTFSWSSSTTSSPTVTVTGRDAADNTAITVLTFVNDSTGPTGGTVSYTNGSVTGSVTVSFTNGADTAAGLKSGSGILQRASATLTNGSCGGYGAFATVTGGTNPTSPFTDSTTSTGNCYQYRYQYSDNLDNQSTFTSSNVVKVTTYAQAVNTETGALAQYRLGESSPVVNDDYTGSNNTTLQSHTGATGATWTKNTNLSDANSAIIASNRIRKSTSAGKGQLYTASGTPASADYKVEAEFTRVSAVSGDSSGLLGRCTSQTASTASCYVVRRDQGGAITLHYLNSGTLGAALGTYNMSNAGDTARISLDMSGTSIAVMYDGASVISVTNSSLSGAGYAGVVFGNPWSSGASYTLAAGAGVHVDSFRVYPRLTDSKGTYHGGYNGFPSTGTPSPGALTGDSNSAASFNVNGSAPQANADYGRMPAYTFNDMSVEFWFKSAQGSGGGTPGDQWWWGASLVDADTSSGSGNDWGISLFANGQVAAGIGNPDTTITSVSGGYNNNAWHYVVFTRSSAGSMKLYIDGVQVAYGTGPTSARDGGAEPRIGRTATGGNPYVGALDEIAFYTSVLPPLTIADHYGLGVSADTIGPIGGSVDATGLVGTGSRYSTSTTLNIALDKGGDPNGVAATGAQLRRSTATLTSSGQADGTCGTYNASTQIGSNDPVSPVADVVPAAQACYRYEYVVTDGIGNTTTYLSNDIKIDNTAPTATLSFSSLTNVIASGNTAYITRGATSGAFTVTASASDTESGISSYSFPSSLGTGWSVSGSGSSRTYSWSAANPPTQNGAQNITATNGAGIASAAAGMLLGELTTELAPGYTPCSGENGTCTFNGTRLVAYGAGAYVYKIATGSIACTNTQFGHDPAPTVSKSCFVAPLNGPTSYTQCATENNTCSFSGTRMVVYGAGGAFNYKLATTSVSCDNATFGSDPLTGATKACYLPPTGAPTGGWVSCAAEAATCSALNGQQIAYGAQGAFKYLTATGNTSCTAAVFGDPNPGTTKACYTRNNYASDYPTLCANENGSCNFIGSVSVAFGARGKFVYKTFTNTVSCSNAWFGSDPMPGISKVCYRLDQVTVANPGNQASPRNTALSLQVNVLSTAGSTLTYSATGLPTGLSINTSTGVISGTPSANGTYNPTVTATDANGPAGSASFTWTISTSTCSVTQLMGNAGFEGGSDTPWTYTNGGATSSTAPRSGSKHGLIGGDTTAKTETVYQSVSIGASCTTATFSFWKQIVTNEQTGYGGGFGGVWGDGSSDTFTVEVRNSANTATLATLATYTNQNASGTYQQHAFNLAAYAGQTIILRFTSTSDSGDQTSLYLDDTALTVG